MAEKNEAILREATRALEFIYKDRLSPGDREQIVNESIEHFNEHVNPGWLRYSKSVAMDTVLVEWEGTQETFKDPYGNEFVDCLGGCGANIAGHQNPEIIKAVQAQLNRHALHNPELLDPLRGYLARLVSMSAPGDLKYVHFCNEATEAIELALNFARVTSDNYFIISTVNACHGKSFGAASAAGKVAYSKSYLPKIKGVQHVEFGNSEAAEIAIMNLIAVGETVAAVIVEPIQVTAGIVIPPDNYLQQMREICDRYGVLLIIDEIQTGMGRTGTFWACEGCGVVPDILVFGKAIGGGVMPITGIITREHLWVEELVNNPWILSQPTTAGMPLACAVAIATIKLILENDIPNQIARKGDYMLAKLKVLRKKHTILLDVRGKGLLIGLEYPTPEIGRAVSEALLKRGVAIGRALNNPRVIRIEPPGVIRLKTIDTIVSKLDNAMSATAKDLALSLVQAENN
ncbi:MAG: aminotransferase class III-fold pyridoxal phosphate-dependent enzyme [Deltaproteobacteria bacterium]|nr:aminotransferase class III-fold pyridoxal phosphate-dependent enzyme [Deltaproteobacteria bacterium]